MNKQIKLYNINLGMVKQAKEKELGDKRNDVYNDIKSYRKYMGDIIKETLELNNWTKEANDMLNKILKNDSKFNEYESKYKEYQDLLHEEYVNNNDYNLVEEDIDGNVVKVEKNNIIRGINSKNIKDKNTIAVGSNNLTRTLGLDLGTFTNKFIEVECGNSDRVLAEQVINNGLMIDNNYYIFFTAGAGQTRTRKFLMILEEVWEEHKMTLMCGLTIEAMNKAGGCNINKFLAYLALNNSASELFEDFNIDKCIVVEDFETLVNYKVDYITRNDKVFDREIIYNKNGKECTRKQNKTEWKVSPEEMNVPIPIGDGAGLILPKFCKKYINKNIQVRLPWIKGLLVPVNFKDYAENVAKNTKIKDIYGKEWDIVTDDVRIIFTKSQFKLWKYYKTNGENSWEVYKNYFNEYNCTANICKVDPEKYKDVQLNYQFLQTLTDMTDKQIKLLTSNYVDLLNKVHKDRESVLDFLGANNENRSYFQEALHSYPEMCNSNPVKKQISQAIQKAKKDACSGRLILKGTKRMFLVPDVVALMEWWFKGKLDKDYIPVGALKDKQVYCKLYEDISKVDVLRSPHLAFEHAVRNNVATSEKVNENSTDAEKLRDKYFITNGIYTSSHDLISKILVFDEDGDEATVVSMDWFVKLAEDMINKYNVVPLYYEMGKADAIEINKNNIYNSLKFAWSCNIGKVSNALTKIWNSDTAWEDYNISKKLCLYNNFIIDSAKTLLLPKKAKDVQETFKTLSDRKYPYFFQFAKDKEVKAGKIKPEEFCNTYSNSVMDRICKQIDNIDADDKFDFGKEFGKFNYKNLMRRQRNFEINEDIIEFYIELEKETRKKVNDYYFMADEDKVKSGYKYDCYIEARQKVQDYAKKNNIKYELVIDNIIKYSFQKDDLKMAFLFEVFGAIIIQNINRNIKEKLDEGYILCDTCGERVKKTNNRMKRCKECGEEENRKKTSDRKKDKKAS